MVTLEAFAVLMGTTIAVSVKWMDFHETFLHNASHHRQGKTVMV